MTRVARLMILSWALAALTPLAGWPAGPAAAAGEGLWPRLVLTDNAPPRSLDPMEVVDSVSRRACLQVFEGLVYLEGPGVVRPRLALSWRQAGPGLWRFQLRPGVSFHNGEPFDADAAAYSLRRAINGSNGRLLALDSVRVVDGLTLDLVSKAPDFLERLAYGGFMVPPVHSAAGRLAAEPVGTGPYCFTGRDHQGLRLAWFPGYWNQGPGFRAAEVLINSTLDSDQRRQWLLSGLSQVAVGLNPHLKLSLLRAGAPVRLYSQPSARQYFVVINPSAQRPANQVALADQDFREALNEVVDTRRIIQVVLLGNGAPLAGPLNDQVAGADDLRPYPYRAQAARRTIRRLAPQGLSLTLAVPSGRYAQAESVAKAVARYLEQAGLRVEIRSVPWPEFLERVETGQTREWDLYYLGWGNPWLSPGYTLNGRFCGGPLCRACPPDLSRLLRETDTAVGPVRDRLFAQANRRVHAFAPWIFLYQGVDNYATTRALSLTTHPDESLRIFYDLKLAGR